MIKIDKSKLHLSGYWIEAIKSHMLVEPVIPSYAAEMIYKENMPLSFVQVSAMLFAVEMVSE